MTMPDGPTGGEGGPAAALPAPARPAPDGDPAGEGDGRPRAVEPPAISLPKGGGAIRGIGEKFAANPATGTGSMSVPIATSPGRSGFGPELTLTYDSGNGNGPFGFGWDLSLPSITRKTDNGLPRYDDAQESDVFILSGAEDLVPVLRRVDDNGWERRPADPGRFDGRDFAVERYRPRVEGLFARIERWTGPDGDVHWRSISRDNVTTLYGTDGGTRIADPDAPDRVFSWLISASYDDKGNAIVYEYLGEDEVGVDLALPNERNRTRTANRYVKRIKYGNTESRLTHPDLDAMDWLFEVVFDYGDGHVVDVDVDDELHPSEQHRYVRATREAGGPWSVRPDPFSSYRSGFEVRTYRRCRRILTFHDIPDVSEREPGYRGLVRSTEFDYDDLGEVDEHGEPVSPDAEYGHQGSTRFASFLRRVTQSGYRPDRTRGYLRKSLPTLEFEYSKATIDETVRTPDRDSSENLPLGIDGVGYRLVDLDGEGVPGILSDQDGAWHYKPGRGDAEFGAVEVLDTVPSTAAVGAGASRLLDLSGDGQLDVVDFDGPTPGFYERTHAFDWAEHRPFRSLPNLDWADPAMRFVDLDGGGHADVLVAAPDRFSWYRSLAEDGFGELRTVRVPRDDESGPRVSFDDGVGSIFLADMAGDGLTDLVRIRNGEVSYWPNLGHGRFGAKVTLDNSPQFDHPDRFDLRRIRLADIDGSGTGDLIYLSTDGPRIYFNQSGNRLTDARELATFPRIDDVTSVTTADLRGNGTACLVWSSTLPGDAGHPLRYIDLMGGTKPRLLVRSANNLGAETEVTYAPSTRFYLADKRAGRPWVTRLPFPVHVVEKVVTIDRVSGNRFVTRYAYHHGYFEGQRDREFRGFGLVEQWDTEFYDVLAGDDAPATNEVESSHVPPVLTRTWFHTGVHVGRRQVSSLHAARRPAEGGYYREPGRDAAQVAALLLEDTALPDDLTLEEEYEACRALRGSMLRQEVYALDGSGTEEYPYGHPYTVVEQNQSVRPLQPRSDNRHAVFLAHPLEQLTYHYERNPADPRVGHELTLAVDDWGNVTRSASVGYGRRPEAAGELAPAHDLIQRRVHLTYTENEPTGFVDDADAYRAPLPAETRSFELTGLGLPGAAIRFDVEGLVIAGENALTLDYEHQPAPPGLWKRLIEHERTYYRADDLDGQLGLNELESRALPDETYRLAFTPGLVTDVYDGRVGDGELLEAGYVHLDGDGSWWIPSGRTFYSPDPEHAPHEELAYAEEHFFLPCRFRDPFHTEEASTESFVEYDPHGLMPQETRDALGNRVTVGERDVGDPPGLVVGGHDYRVLQPALVMDPNRNRSEVAFDALGMVAGTAVMGKPLPEVQEGDSLAGFSADLTDSQVAAFFADPTGTPATNALAAATSRTVYDLRAYERAPAAGPDASPAWSATVAAETHARDTTPLRDRRIQIAFTYSDGFGREIQKKLAAEPGAVPRRSATGRIRLDEDNQPVMTGAPHAPRWVGTGWTVVNNKGKPVRRYEPFFTDRHSYEFDERIGVSSILFYDPAERVVGTLHPDHTWEKVRFDAWRQTTWDVNDTAGIDAPVADPVLGDFFNRLDVGDHLPTWHQLRTSPLHLARAQRRWPDLTTRTTVRSAARATELHHDTPTVTHADSLGRTFLTIAENRAQFRLPAPEPVEQRSFRTRSRLDIEGNEREVIDARDRSVMRYGYDMLGNRVHQSSMEAGRRWMLNDVLGKPLDVWDDMDHRFHTEYDALRRPVGTRLSTGGGGANLIERTWYGEQLTPVPPNFRGQVARQHDQAGIHYNEQFDFKGNLVQWRRRLTTTFDTTIDWSTGNGLEAESFTGLSRFDALNRVVQTIAPLSDAPGTKVNVTQQRYNAANLLERVEVWLDRATVPVGLLTGAADVDAITNIDYDAKGQRTLVRRGTAGGAVTTTYEYDRQTFRLLRIRTDGGRQDLRYTYDPIGNITNIRDDAQQVIFFDNHRVEPTADFTYDSTYRLIEATGREQLGAIVREAIVNSYNDAGRVGLGLPGNGSELGRYRERYEYDEVGNVTAIQHDQNKRPNLGWRREYTYGEQSQLGAVGESSNRLTSTYVAGTTYTYSNAGGGYDAHGNMLEMPHLSEMRWDFRDQLRMTSRQAVNARDADGVDRQGEQTWYVYDAAGSRVRKVTRTAAGAIKDERVYLGGFEVYRRYGGANPLTRETLHVMDDQQRVTLIDRRTAGHEAGVPARLVRHQFANHLGSATLELDHQAQVISYEEYSPYGSTTFHGVLPTAAPKRWSWLGKERDAECGFYFHGARFYVPWLARWTATDPSGLQDGVALYSYARDNPIRFADHDGNFASDMADAWESTGIGIGVFGPVPFTGEHVSDRAQGVAETVAGALIDRLPQGDDFLSSATRGYALLNLTRLKTAYDVGVGIAASAIDIGSAVRGVMHFGVGSAQGVENIDRGNVAVGASQIAAEVFGAALIVLGGVSMSRAARLPRNPKQPGGVSNAANKSYYTEFENAAANTARGPLAEVTTQSKLQPLIKSAPGEIGPWAYPARVKKIGGRYRATRSGGRALRTKPDALIRSKGGKTFIEEAKSTQTAELTRNQRLGFPLLEEAGGVVVEAGSGGAVTVGEVLGPTPSQIIRPPQLIGRAVRGPAGAAAGTSALIEAHRR